MIILPPDIMTQEEIQKLNDNGLCVTVASDPSKLKFIDPLPAQSSRTEVENAAIRLSRMILNGQYSISGTSGYGRDFFARCFVEFLVQGTPLDEQGTREQQEQKIIDRARRDELDRIGREEARAEAKARKEAKEKLTNKK